MNNIFSIKNHLSFECTSCGTLHSESRCECGNSFFKVSRSIPLINAPLDPYRNKDDQDNGYYLSNPGDFESSMGGAEVYDFPQDGSDVDNVGFPNAKSDDLTQDESMRDVNRGYNSRDRMLGVHSINSFMPVSEPSPSVFQRTKSKMLYNYTGGR